MTIANDVEGLAPGSSPGRSAAGCRKYRAATQRGASLVLLLLAGCATVPNPPARAPGQGMLACMQGVVRERIAADLPDKTQHCRAAGLIARYCGLGSARIASYGKEVRDAFGRGDASAGDLRADRAGMACARRSADDAAVVACCAAQGF